MTSARHISRHLATFLPSSRHALVVSVVTLLLSWLLHALTRTPFAIVISRLGFVAACLLLAYSVAGKAHPRWLSPSAARLLAMAVAAPLASIASTVLTQGSAFLQYLSKTETLIGHILMMLLALLLGIPLALIAMRTERKALEKTERLQAELEKSRLERELLDARLRLLQAQIEPHFLFNTLANIEALVASGSDNAGPVLRHLIAYLRAAMPRLNDADATLGAELDLVRAYLELMHLRMPDRLQFEVASLPSIAAQRFPAMALLTLVENAVRHGIDPSMEGGRIEVNGRYDETDSSVVLWVRDSGAGMAETALPGTGLSNVRARLQACFGMDAALQLHEETPHGVRVELHFQLKGNA